MIDELFNINLFLILDNTAILKSNRKVTSYHLSISKSYLILLEHFKPLKKALDYVLEASLDPWEYIHSVSTEAIKQATAHHIDPVCDFYDIEENRCMVLGNISHTDIICAHRYEL